jgi:alpha/beta superfamily hydrolase
VAGQAAGLPLISLPETGRAETLLLPGPAGNIEALVAMPPAPPAAFAVVCHPHPLQGGALTNKVTYTLASCALKAGLAAARFNFRGVGASHGRHDEGRGETDDALAVIGWMRERLPGAKLLLAGFSFGAFVSLKAAARAGPQLQVSIAPPFRYFAQEPRPARPPCPWLVVHGRDDEVVDYEETRAELAVYEPKPELVTLDGVGHFFHGRLGDLEGAVSDFIRRHPPA